MGKVLLYGTVLISDRLGYNTTNSVWPGYNVIVIKLACFYFANLGPISRLIPHKIDKMIIQAGLSRATLFAFPLKLY